MCVESVDTTHMTKHLLLNLVHDNMKYAQTKKQIEAKKKQRQDTINTAAWAFAGALMGAALAGLMIQTIWM